MPELVPGNPIEHGLERLRAGLIDLADFLPTLVFGDIIVPSATEPQPDGSGFTPLLYDKGGVALIAACTSATRISTVDGAPPHFLVIRAGEFMQRMSAGYGLILNPGWSLGMELSPEGIRRIVDNMAEPIFDT